MKLRTLKQILIVAVLSLLMSCGGGSGGSGGNGASLYTGGVPYIFAELDSFPSGSEPINFQCANVHVIDSSNGNPITTATVAINGIPLAYNSLQQKYQGNPIVNQGASVNLVVTVGEVTYTAAGSQFTSYPSISVPTSGTVWQASFANTVSWSTGMPTTNAFYGLGILNADSGNVVWPSNGNLQTVQSGTMSYSFPANNLPVGNCHVIVGIATTLSIPDSAAGSAFVISGFSSVPVTVIDGSGTHWTQRQAAWSTDDFKGIAWSGTQFVTVGGNSGHILTSPDGATWTRQTSGNLNPLSGVAWGGNQFVAVGSSGTVLTSPDGVTWTSRNSGTTAHLTDVIWTGNKFLAVGTTYNSSTGFANIILTSSDGVNWTITLLGTHVYLYQVTWSGSQFLAVGGLGGSSLPVTNVILTSSDGVTWTSRTAGTSNQLLGVTWSGTEFVIVGAGGTILTSPDSITWTLRTSGTTATLFNVTWSGLNFVAVGQDRTILTSPDGITWTTLTPDYIYSLDLYDIIWTGKRFVVVGEGGSIFSSP